MSTREITSTFAFKSSKQITAEFCFDVVKITPTFELNYRLVTSEFVFQKKEITSTFDFPAFGTSLKKITSSFVLSLYNQPVQAFNFPSFIQNNTPKIATPVLKPLPSIQPFIFPTQTCNPQITSPNQTYTPQFPTFTQPTFTQPTLTQPLTQTNTAKVSEPTKTDVEQDPYFIQEIKFCERTNKNPFIASIETRSSPCVVPLSPVFIPQKIVGPKVDTIFNKPIKIEPLVKIQPMKSTLKSPELIKIAPLESHCIKLKESSKTFYKIKWTNSKISIILNGKERTNEIEIDNYLIDKLIVKHELGQIEFLSAINIKNVNFDEAFTFEKNSIDIDNEKFPALKGKFKATLSCLNISENKAKKICDKNGWNLVSFSPFTFTSEI